MGIKINIVFTNSKRRITIVKTQKECPSRDAFYTRTQTSQQLKTNVPIL